MFPFLQNTAKTIKRKLTVIVKLLKQYAKKRCFFLFHMIKQIGKEFLTVTSKAFLACKSTCFKAVCWVKSKRFFSFSLKGMNRIKNRISEVAHKAVAVSGPAVSKAICRTKLQINRIPFVSTGIKWMRDWVIKTTPKVISTGKAAFIKAIHWITSTSKRFVSFVCDAGRLIVYRISFWIQQTKPIGFTIKARAIGATALTLVITFTFAVAGICNTEYVVAVEQNGEVIAYVEDEQVYQDAKDMVTEQLAQAPMDSGEVASEQVEENVSAVTLKSAPGEVELENEMQLSQTLLQNIDEDVTIATGLYVDGSFYGATTEPEVMNVTLEQMKANYATSQGVTPQEVNVKSDVRFVEGVYPTSSIMNGQQISERMQGEIETQQYYTMQEGDTLLGIATNTGVDYNTILALNPGLDECTLQIGQQLLLNESKPLISLSVVKQIQYQEEVPYGQEQQQNANLEKGLTKVVQSGQNGLVLTTAQVEIVNGQEVGRTVLSQVTERATVPEVVEVGTKETTDFIRPLKSGYVSQGYSSSHQAVDIAASTGTPVLASAGGKVVKASWYSTYGNCVIIDHGNGQQTLYAHLSKINVGVGQTVSQGQQIGAVGSTGNSTGPHLHFEIRVGGSKVNPFKYCKI